MRALVALHGQPGWVAALTPLSVDGMILAASATLLADSRSGRKGGALLIAGSVASLAANVAVAEPTLIGRVIAAWPSFALTASYELLTRQVRRSAVGDFDGSETSQQQWRRAASSCQALARRPPLATSAPERQSVTRGDELQRQAWQWALSKQVSDGALPSGKAIASAHGRHERWGSTRQERGSGRRLRP